MLLPENTWKKQILLGVPSISILSRDPSLSRKPHLKPRLKTDPVFVERTMVETNGQGINP